MDTHLINMLWVVICAALVLIMQAGFLCLESGCTRTKNSINVAVKNITDFGLSIILYWAVGFGLMFGLSIDGVFGGSHFFVEAGPDSPWLSTFFIFQAMFCGTSVTIVSGAVAERLSFKGYIVIALLVSALIYPIFGHWAWGGALEGASGWLGKLGFIDFAGSTVVHSIGGWVALAAVIVLGPRLGRFGDDNTSNQIPGQSLPLAMLGSLILCFGWIGFNGGSTLAWGGDVPAIITQTILAASAGLITALLIGWIRFGHPEVKCGMNGLIAGLVAITASCNIVSSKEAILIGAIGSIFMIAAERLLERLRIDDVVGSFPVHTAAGIWGTLAVALFGDTSAFAEGLDRWSQMKVQGIGVAACAAIGFMPTYLILSGIRYFVSLRVTEKAELMGLNAAEHRATTEHLDLLHEMELQSRKMDLTHRVNVEPFTEIGQIAEKYNEVLDSLEQTVSRNELIIRDTKDGILTCSQNGMVLSANLGAEQMLGHKTEEFAQMSIWSIIATESDASFSCFGDLVNYIELQNSKINGLRLIALKKSGERFPVALEVTSGFIGNHDVTTIKMRDRSVSENYQKQLKIAKHDAEKNRDELRHKVQQIESFNRLAIDRESRMMELKEQINRLSKELGRTSPFSFSAEDQDRN